MKAKEAESTRITRDPIKNITTIHACIPEFIWYVQQVNQGVADLAVVIAGSHDMLQECNKVLKDSEQVLPYDTTFCLGEFYLSPLSFRHTEFRESQLCQHSSYSIRPKSSLTMKYCLNFFSDKTRSNKGVAIVTDGEASFAKAIDIQTNMEHFGCWRHMINDIKQWLSDHGGSRDDRIVYEDDVYELFKCKSLTACEAKLEE